MYFNSNFNSNNNTNTFNSNLSHNDDDPTTAISTTAISFIKVRTVWKLVDWFVSWIPGYLNKCSTNTNTNT